MVMALYITIGAFAQNLSLKDIYIRDPYILPIEKEGTYYMYLKSATTRLYDTEAKIICIVSKKGAQCIECHHKDI